MYKSANKEFVRVAQESYFYKTNGLGNTKQTRSMSEKELEAGYLAALFSEPVYLMGYENTTYTEELMSTQIPVVQEESPIVKKEEVKISLPTEEKKEVKSIPVTPKLQTTPQKIAKKCIVLFSSDEDELSSKEIEFLGKVMGAAQLQPADYDCVNFKGITITDVASRYSFDKLILFSVKIPGLEIEQYKCTKVKSTLILSADAVWMIEANTNLKKLLWDQLQFMFGLKK